MVQLWQSRKKRSPAGMNVRKYHQQFSSRSSPRVVRYKSQQAVQRRRWYGLFQSLSARQPGWSGGTRGQRNVARGRLFRSGDSNVGRSSFLGETSEQVLDCCSWAHTDIINYNSRQSIFNNNINQYWHYIDIILIFYLWSSWLRLPPGCLWCWLAWRPDTSGTSAYRPPLWSYTAGRLRAGSGTRGTWRCSDREILLRQSGWKGNLLQI